MQLNTKFIGTTSAHGCDQACAATSTVELSHSLGQLQTFEGNPLPPAALTVELIVHGDQLLPGSHPVDHFALDAAQYIAIGSTVIPVRML